MSLGGASLSSVDRATPQPAIGQESVDPLERRVRRSWWLFGTALGALGTLVLLRATVLDRAADLAVLLLLVLVGLAAIANRQAVEARDSRRRAELEEVARILQGFSRAVSPDGVIEAILGALGQGTGADHLVVVRRRPGAPILDATLVSTRPGVPASSVVLPSVDLDQPGPPAGGALFDGAVNGFTPVPVGPGRPSVGAAAAIAAAGRVETRVRRAFGLTHTIAVPLLVGDEAAGAIVISRRRAGPWPESTRRVLDVAAVEASAALARASSHRAAETRAATDPLTGLPNRRYFEEYVELLGRRRRADDTLGVLMVDVDRFKAVNDRHGHAAGDLVLRAIGRAIADAVRDVDVPARFGGEEFVVLLRNPSRAVVLEVGERIRAAVAGLDLRRTGVGGVTVSVGATIAADPAEPVELIVERADRALYRAKRFGRNRVEGA